MSEIPIDINKIFSINSDNQFNDIALEIFHWQAKNVSVYREFIHQLGIDPQTINSLYKIPFLPIQLFKSRKVIAENFPVEKLFKSSGTMNTGRSCHYVADLKLYKKSFNKCFETFYGDPSDICLIALLPSYLEQGDSSLIYMIDSLISQSKNNQSCFLLNSGTELQEKLQQLQQTKTKTILWGVTYALLDFIEKFKFDFPELTVMETGGMKGRRKELTKNELHGILCAGFGVKSIHSEYGMTELLSQAYSLGNGIFQTPPWMKILIRDTNDPLHLSGNKKTGGINIIDLANLYSCSFIATQDLGKTDTNNTFEILGRFDHSDTRGCNLLVQ